MSKLFGANWWINLPQDGKIFMFREEHFKYMKECSKFMTSVILGDDIIARLNMHSMQKLRGEVVLNLQNCHESKMNVLL